MKPPSSLLLAPCALSLAAALPLAAADVSFHRHEDRDTDGVVEQLRYFIDGAPYQSAVPLDWTLLANFSGMDVAAVSAKFPASFVGLKIIPCLDAKGKPATAISQESFDAIVAALRDPRSEYEARLPSIKEPVTSLDFDMKRTDAAGSWQCRYRLKVVEEKVWIFASELSADASTEGGTVYATLEGTFSKRNP